MSEVPPGAQEPNGQSPDGHGPGEKGGGLPGAPPAAPLSTGAALRERREQQGLDLTEVARRTRVPIRHLQAIEAGDYGSLPSVTYAVGFARAYARAVGANEVSVAAEVRRDVDRLGRRRPEYEPYVTADPARVPSRGLAAVAAGLAVAVAVLALLYFTTDLFRPVTGTPGGSDAVVASATPPVQPAATPPVAPAAPSPTGQVRLTANDEVWIRVSDAANKTLKIGTLQSGESYDVPRDAEAPMLNVGRPDKLAVTLDGRALPPLGTGERPVRVGIGAAALSQRLAGTGTPAAAAPERPAGPPLLSRPVPDDVSTASPAEPSTTPSATPATGTPTAAPEPPAA